MNNNPNFFAGYQPGNWPRISATIDSLRKERPRTGKEFKAALGAVLGFPAQIQASASARKAGEPPRMEILVDAPDGPASPVQDLGEVSRDFWNRYGRRPKADESKRDEMRIDVAPGPATPARKALRRIVEGDGNGR